MFDNMEIYMEEFRNGLRNNYKSGDNNCVCEVAKSVNKQIDSSKKKMIEENNDSFMDRQKMQYGGANYNSQT